MLERPRGAGLRWFLILALLLALFVQGYVTLRSKAPTFDEPAHIGAGLSYLKTGDFKLNLQHPPLLKEIGAIPLILTGTRWPVTPEAWADVTTSPDLWLQWQIGLDILSGDDRDKVMFWSRLPFLGLTLLLAGLLYIWGRKVVGGAAALGGLFLFALDPSIVAHGPLVTTDVGFAAFALLFVLTLHLYLSRRSLPRLLACGATLGLALAAKFSGVILFPLAAVLLFVAARSIPPSADRRPSTLADPYASPEGAQRIVWCVYSLITLTAIAALVVHALYFFPSDPFIYLEGFGRINADHDPSYHPYMAGEFKAHFWTYYVLAYLLKEPLASLLLTALGLWAILRRGAVTPLNRAFLLLPPAFLFLGYTISSDNLGFRYIIPALPFLHLAGGTGLVGLARGSGTWRKVLAVLLCAWVIVAAAGIFPDDLSYFNEMACLLKEPSRLGLDGGSACGPRWLDDSNVDWGQSLKQLKAWIDQHAAGRMLNLGYFGSIRPEFYGVVFNRIAGKDLTSPLPPGLYAISAHLVARGIGELASRHGTGPGNWLLHTPPVAVIGHAYYIYDIPERSE